MNPLNYASLEASKRLVEGGIALETDFYWIKSGSGYDDNWLWSLSHTNKVDYLSPHEYQIKESYPAPSMAELWRELPGYVGGELTLDVTKSIDVTCARYSKIDMFDEYVTKADISNTNPTDCLIDLLILVRKEKR